MCKNSVELQIMGPKERGPHRYKIHIVMIVSQETTVTSSTYRWAYSLSEIFGWATSPLATIWTFLWHGWG